ncbi:hypothetical protein DOTSEDRAFT_44718 [Dothistroma septosporum NZE10]|uniref:Uncharacterized protein n=1 Tax=Dothistroma septosporum (strain NZE10 / CBS 128990) TaxID=675120 RepID=N1PQ81_DOTSN|nr:hypothetical protein DOTSEDRAFT_44718 [Dothistroma septosporum NZE10]
MHHERDVRPRERKLTLEKRPNLYKRIRPALFTKDNRIWHGLCRIFGGVRGRTETSAMQPQLSYNKRVNRSIVGHDGNIQVSLPGVD